MISTDLQDSKKVINEAGFTSEALEVLNRILDKAIADGGLSVEQKTQLLAIIDLEKDRAMWEADRFEDAASVITRLIEEKDKKIG